MEHQSKRAARPWIFGALFVWALTGAVAITAFSSHPTGGSAGNVAAIEKLALQPVPPAALPSEASIRASANRSKSEAKNGAKLGGIVWADSFEAAMQRARSEKKPLMIDFYTDWCSWCKELDARVYPDAAVVSEAKNWVSIRINAEKRPDVAGAYNVSGFPTIVFAENTGKPIDVMSGFSPAPEFVQAMQSARAKWSPRG